MKSETRKANVTLYIYTTYKITYNANLLTISWPAVSETFQWSGLRPSLDIIISDAASEQTGLLYVPVWRTPGRADRSIADACSKPWPDDWCQHSERSMTTLCTYQCCSIIHTCTSRTRDDVTRTCLLLTARVCLCACWEGILRRMHPVVFVSVCRLTLFTAINTSAASCGALNVLHPAPPPPFPSYDCCGALNMARQKTVNMADRKSEESKMRDWEEDQACAEQKWNDSGNRKLKSCVKMAPVCPAPPSAVCQPAEMNFDPRYLVTSSCERLKIHLMHQVPCSKPKDSTVSPPTDPIFLGFLQTVMVSYLHWKVIVPNLAVIMTIIPAY